MYCFVLVCSGGDFFVFLGQLQFHHTNNTGIYKKSGQLVHDLFVGSLGAAGAAVLVSGGKLFKRITLVLWHHTSAVHADGISLFKEELFLAAEFVKSRLYSIGTNTVPENVRIVPAIVTGNIFDRFLAVLVLHGRIERNTAAVSSCKGQILGSGFFGAVLLGGIFGNLFLCALAGIIVEPCNATRALYRPFSGACSDYMLQVIARDTLLLVYSFKYISTCL